MKTPDLKLYLQKVRLSVLQEQQDIRKDEQNRSNKILEKMNRTGATRH
jgi:hypothetical protein